MRSRSLAGSTFCLGISDARPAHLVLCITVPYRFESKTPIKPHKPTRQPIQHLGQRRMNIKVIFASYIVSCKGPKVDFVEYDLAGVGDSPESEGECAEKEEEGGDE